MNLTAPHQFGLIGSSLTHSFSQQFFHAKFTQNQLHCKYTLFELDHIDKVTKLLGNPQPLSGLNVTLPFKVAVIPYLQSLSPAAQAIGAVNTLLRRETGEWEGHNTDWRGFLQTLYDLPIELPLRAIVLGAGGAARAVIYALHQFSPEPHITLVARRPQTLQINLLPMNSPPILGGAGGVNIGSPLSISLSAIPFSALVPSYLESHPLIINTTPLGMYPHVHASPELPYAALTPRHILYDLIYNPETTRFLQMGLFQHCTVRNGKPMLIRQAEEAWNIWNTYHAIL